MAGQRDRTAVGRQLAVDHVEGRRLAGAIGADQRQQLAGRQRETDAIDGAVAAEALAEIAYLQKCHRIDQASRHGTSSAGPSTDRPVGGAEGRGLRSETCKAVIVSIKLPVTEPALPVRRRTAPSGGG